MSTIIQGNPMAQMPANVQNVLQNTEGFNVYMKEAEQKLHQAASQIYQLVNEVDRLEQQLKKAQAYHDKEILIREALRGCTVPQNEIVVGVPSSTSDVVFKYATEVADLIISQRPKEEVNAESNIITAS